MLRLWFRTALVPGCTLALALLVYNHPLSAQDADSAGGDNTDLSAKWKVKITGLPERPKVGKDVVTVLKETGKYSTFLKLADQAGLMPLLRGTERDSASADVTFQDSAMPQISSSDLTVNGQLPPGIDVEKLRSEAMDVLARQLPQATLRADQITVFVPTDAAFQKLSKATRDSLQSNPDFLLKLLRGHLVNTGIEKEPLVMLRDIQTLNGTTLPVTLATAAAPKIANANIVESTFGDNGLIYGIDTVIRR